MVRKVFRHSGCCKLMTDSSFPVTAIMLIESFFINTRSKAERAEDEVFCCPASCSVVSLSSPM